MKCSNIRVPKRYKSKSSVISEYFFKFDYKKYIKRISFAISDMCYILWNYFPVYIKQIFSV